MNQKQILQVCEILALYLLLGFLTNVQSKDSLGSIILYEGKNLVSYNLDSNFIESYTIATGHRDGFYRPFPKKINKQVVINPLYTQLFYPIINKNRSATYLVSIEGKDDSLSYEILTIRLDSDQIIERIYRTEREILPLGLVELSDHYILYRDVYHSEDTAPYYSWGYTVIPKPTAINAMVLDRDLTDISEGKWVGNNLNLFYSGKSTQLIRTYHDLTSEEYYEKVLPINSSVLFSKLSRSGTKVLVLNNKGKDTLEIYDILNETWQTVMDFSVRENVLWVFSQWSIDDDKVAIWVVKTNSKNKCLFNQDIYIYDLNDKKLGKVFSFKPMKLFSPSNYILWNSSHNYLLLKQGNSESVKYKLIILDIKNKKIVKTIAMEEPWKIRGWF